MLCHDMIYIPLFPCVSSATWKVNAENSVRGVDIDGAVTERTPLWWSGRNQVEVTKRAHIIKALLYSFQSFYAFMLM